MINHNKAYILGLIVGGGRLDTDSFIIELPFKKWGMDPSKMGTIAVDILGRISKLFDENYGIKVTYEIGNKKWTIKPVNTNGYNLIQQDLESYKLPSSGFILNEADLTVIRSKIKGITSESFISGIFDARASIAKSQRRFKDDAPVVSLEIPGSTKNFQFVVQICSWLTDLGSTTDQILYNHPNQHSGSDPFYSGWKKGFKIRFLVKSFLARHSFALQAKALDITKLEKQQNKTEQDSCPFRKIKSPSGISVHKDNNSEDLPHEVNNKLFFHYFHFCASLGCKHAPKSEVDKLVDKKEKYISFFPYLSKGSIQETSNIYEQIKLSHFPSIEVKVKNSSVNHVINNPKYKGYTGMQRGIAYLFAKELSGKRHKGPMSNILRENEGGQLEIEHFFGISDEPIRIVNSSNNRSIVISSKFSKKNLELINTKTTTKGVDIILHERN